MKSSMPRFVTFATIALCTAVSMIAGAQTKRKSGDKPRPAATAERSPKESTKAPPPESSKASEEGDAGVTPPSRTTSAAAASTSKDAGAVVEQKSVDGGTQVFRFSEVEVEGPLKSPQIVYFLRRVRAEFAATDLGHRSFSRELGETRNEPAFE